MLFNAFKDTLTLMNVRYQIIRDTKNKFALWFFISMMAVGVFAASYTGQFIKLLAGSKEPNIEAAQIYATIYLNSYLNGEIGSIIATTLGLAILSVMIAPFTGASATSLISHHNLVSVRSNMKHRFTDSIITQFVSSISILQLVTLTSVASMLTLDGGRREGVLYAWASWPVLVILSTMFVWIAEYLYRRFGEKRRLIMLGITLGFIGLIVFSNQEEASTVFGVGTVYAELIRNFGTFPVTVQLLAFGILVGIWFLFAFIAYKISQIALSYPDMFAKQNVAEKKIKGRKTSKNPLIELCKLAVMQVWRNMEIRKPLLMAVGFSMVSIFLLSSNYSLLSTIVFIIPLMVCLSWGANVFGVLGTGLPWLLSKPFFSRNIIWVFSGLQMVVITAMGGLSILPATITGRLSLTEAISFMVSLIASSAVMTRSSMSKSVHKPHPYRSGQRGDAILPPATLIAYTLRFTLWAGMLGVIIFTWGTTNESLSDGEVLLQQIGLATAAILWSVARIALLNRKFKSDPKIRNYITFTVSST